MKKHGLVILFVVSCVAPGVRPGYAVSKETLQMMQQLDTLQQAVQNLQKTVDAQSAVLKTLIEQASDNVSKIKSNMDDLRDSTQKNLAASNARLDSMTNQMQALGESLDEAKARIGKLGEQLAQTQNIIQTLSAASPPATGAPGTGAPPAGGDAKPQPRVPDPDSLYSSGITDYNSGQYELAIQTFQDYLHYYADTARASNAQFYIGDSYYNEQKYKNAIAEYDKCIEGDPHGNKAAMAQLRKGYALIELGEKAAGVKELRSLISLHPDSDEADLARQRLRKLNAPVAPPRRH